MHGDAGAPKSLRLGDLERAGHEDEEAIVDVARLEQDFVARDAAPPSVRRDAGDLRIGEAGKHLRAPLFVEIRHDRFPPIQPRRVYARFAKERVSVALVDGAMSDHSGAGRYATVRAATEALCRGLAVEDYVAQSMPDCSPVKWHLAHTTWFFEAFVLGAQRGIGRSIRSTNFCSTRTTRRWASAGCAPSAGC